MPTPLLLASASPTRAQVLRSAGLDFEVLPAGVDEFELSASLIAEGIGPRDLADALAEQKARKISARREGALVLGCDQILEFAGAAESKPETRAAARAQLVRLRGGEHRLISAAVIASDGVPQWRATEIARLTMRDFSDTYLDAYLDRNWPAVSGSVGAYRIEEEGVRLFRHLEGSHFAILGLPLLSLLNHLATIGEIAA